MTAGSGRAAAWRAALYALHALLGLWAIRAWIAGPFHGAGILDGAEVLQLATTGRADLVDTKSPLYPALLRAALQLDIVTAWTVGVLGLLASLAVLAGISALARRLAAPRAELPAMALWVLSGSVLAFLPQPLPVLCATALLLWGAVLLLADEVDGSEACGPVRALLAGVGGGALLAASVLTLAPLVVPALLVAVAALRRQVARGAAAGLGALAVLALAFAVLPFPLWPQGAGLNLRLGNGSARSGTTDMRPGPAYDRLRMEPVVAAWRAGATAVSADEVHLTSLARELAGDPAGAALTLLRKLFLFWQRTEIVTDSDFRHGLAGLPVLSLLLLSFGLIAPLALAGLLAPRGVRGGRPEAVWLPVLGVMAVNVATLTSARYRLPALPFLCLAGGLWLASSPPPRSWWLPLLLGVALNLNLSGRALLWPGDGELQEGDLLLAQGVVDPAARALASAAEQGRDPRAAFLLGAAIEREVVLFGDLSLREQSEAWYREALAREPLYPEAADALMKILIAQHHEPDALAFGQAYVARDPWAGPARLTLASMLVQLADKAGTREMLIEGNRLTALAALARNDRAGAQRCATELLRLAARDPALDALTVGRAP